MYISICSCSWNEQPSEICRYHTCVCASSIASRVTANIGINMSGAICKTFSIVIESGSLGSSSRPDL